MGKSEYIVNDIEGKVQLISDPRNATGVHMFNIFKCKALGFESEKYDGQLDYTGDHRYYTDDRYFVLSIKDQETELDLLTILKGQVIKNREIPIKRTLFNPKLNIRTYDNIITDLPFYIEFTIL